MGRKNEWGAKMGGLGGKAVIFAPHHTSTAKDPESVFPILHKEETIF